VKEMPVAILVVADQPVKLVGDNDVRKRYFYMSYVYKNKHTTGMRSKIDGEKPLTKFPTE
jgi:hypothetical protein